MEAVLEFLRGIRVGRIGTRRKPLEENRDGQESGGEGGGRAGPAASVVPFVSSGGGDEKRGCSLSFVTSFVIFCLLSFSFVRRIIGKKGTEVHY